jgi:hypothetical protein
MLFRRKLTSSAAANSVQHAPALQPLTLLQLPRVPSGTSNSTLKISWVDRLGLDN